MPIARCLTLPLMSKPRSECTMHLDRSADDFVSKLIHPVHLCALGSLR